MESISPYALLQASRPKHTPTLVTAYDLFSTVQSETNHSGAQVPSPPAPTVQTTMSPQKAGTNSAFPRTHYIRDIHARHNRLSGRSAF